MEPQHPHLQQHRNALESDTGVGNGPSVLDAHAPKGLDSSPSSSSYPGRPWEDKQDGSSSLDHCHTHGRPGMGPLFSGFVPTCCRHSIRL